MKMSRKWLNEFVDLSLEEYDDHTFGEAMTVSGSKVEVTDDLSKTMHGVKVGRIVSIEKHPNSDHMLVTQIDVGESEPVQICTGAWNIHEGDTVPVALHNSLLPGGVKITKGKLRGVPSNGMLCSLKELGMTTHDFPYAVITPAAILGDYHPIDPEKPSVAADIKAGDRIFGKVIAAQVEHVETVGYSRYVLSLSTGSETVSAETGCMNLHAGDLVAYDTAKNHVCTLDDLRAKQEEFPHCITDGILILNEDCRPGDDVAVLLGLDDHVVDYEITPNRPDCLCMIGLAREASVTFKKPLKLHTPVVNAAAGGNINDMAKIIIEEPELCPRYTARMVKNVKIAPSPAWMRERIRNAGMRPINNIVDITNYVMMEYGQPMHAFDFSCVKDHEIHVRLAREGESIRTLDGTSRALTPSMLCICDTEKPVAVAGVMGGENSEIVGDTAMVLFESANFNGTSIRRTATALGMRTDASSRYEKGLDMMNTIKAVERACELVELLGCGEVVDGVMDVVAKEKAPTVVKLEPDKINALLGTELSEDLMREILVSLGFILNGDDIYVPSWRGDVEHYSDIAEEVARFYGYNKIPCTLMRGETTRGGFSEQQRFDRAIGGAVRALGYDEIITYSFISPTYYDKIRMPKDSSLRNSLKILNPLGEDTSIMRTTILPSMLEIIARNHSYRNKSTRLYELGKIYLPREDGLADEPKYLSLGAYGDGVDFFSFKGGIETLLHELRITDVKYVACTDNDSYHPGRCAKVYAGETYLGVFGQIHPLVAANYGMDTEVYTAELSFDAMYEKRGDIPVYQPLPKFPAVTRDIAVVCDEAVTVGALEESIRRGAKGLLKDVSLFDIYRGPGVAIGKKSVAFNLVLRADDRSLTGEEADEDVQSILAALKADHNAVLR